MSASRAGSVGGDGVSPSGMAAPPSARWRWSDAVGPWGLSLAGIGLMAWLGVRSQLLEMYLSHAWFLLGVLLWWVALGRRVPIGRLNRRGLARWWPTWLAVGGLVLVASLGSQPLLGRIRGAPNCPTGLPGDRGGRGAGPLFAG